MNDERPNAAHGESSGTHASATLADRRCALQALYQMDAVKLGAMQRGGSGRAAPEDHSLVGLTGDEGPGEDPRAVERGMALAAMAWEFSNEADAEVAQLAREWPPHRQPLVDRALLRLGWYELRHTDAPPRKVISDAVELAKEFGTAESGAFINGVLDRIWKGEEADPGTGDGAGENAGTDEASS